MKKTIIFLVVLASIWAGNCVAIVSNVVVSTDLDSIRIIDLSNSISDTYTDITLGNQLGGELPNNGTAMVVGAQLTYTPQTGFVGFENFKYSVFNNGVFISSATISIKVGSASVGVNAANTASEAISDTLSLVCFSQNGSPSSSAMVDLCSDFLNVNPTQGELNALLDELAPKEIDSQDNLSATIAANQIDNIRKRLAALRQGARGVDATRLSLKVGKQKPINIVSLFSVPSHKKKLNNNTLATGGGASNDQLGRSPWGLFLGGNVGSGQHQETDNVDAYAFSTKGSNLGLDYRINRNGVIGAAVGFNTSEIDVDNDKGDLAVSGVSLIGYSSYFVSQSVYIEAILARYQNDFESTRVIDYSVQGVSNSLTAKGETSNGVLSFSLGIGFEGHFQNGIGINMSLSADYIKSTFDGYAESGAGGANLLISKRERDIVKSTFDFQFTYVVSFRSGVFIPQLGIAWKHDFEDQATQYEAVFYGDPTNTPINLNSDSPETDYYKVNLGFSWLYVGGNTIFVNIDSTVGQKGLSDGNVSFGMRFEF